MLASRSSLLTLRRRFAGLPLSAHKDLGLRAVRDALALGDRNPDRAAELAARAAHHALYAEALAARESAR